MTFPHRIAQIAQKPWTVTPKGMAPRPSYMTRRYEIMWHEGGDVLDATVVAPALPAFEAAFTALSRGSLIATPRGEVAVEDLLPGTVVNTRSGPQQVRWVGRILLPPAYLKQDNGPAVYRVSAEAFGTMRPMPDLVLCSGARVAHRSVMLARRSSGSEALVPVGDFCDGVSVTQITPMSAVTAYHVVLDSHSLLDVNGLPVESFHPGNAGPSGLNSELRQQFLRLFPWLSEMRDFGPLAMPRMRLEEIEGVARWA